MDRESLHLLIEQLASEVGHRLIGEDAVKYADGTNLTTCFDTIADQYGKDWALGDIAEKLYRFKTRGNPDDLVKAIGRIVLLISWMEEKHGLNEESE